jgi:hypothetical protein
MRLLFLVSVTIIGLILQTIASASADPIQQTEVSPEDYAVYDAAIDTMFADNQVTFDFGGEVAVKLLVLVSPTDADVEISHIEAGSYDDPLKDYRGRFPSIQPQTVSDYAAKNKHSQLLKPSFNVKVKYVIVEAAEINGGPGSEGFDKKFDGSKGYMRLSGPGFNQDHSQALVYMSYICGGLCGHGFFVFLTKTKGEWKVAGTFRDWIS